MPRIVGIFDIILYTLYSPTVKKSIRYTGPAFVIVSLMQKLALEYKEETKILEQSLRVKSLWDCIVVQHLNLNTRIRHLYILTSGSDAI